MSATRRTTQRAAARSQASLPYARPPLKKSSWSLTGLLSYLNPLRFGSSNNDLEENEEDERSASGSEQEQEQERSPSPELTRAAQTLTARGIQMENDATAGQGISLPVISTTNLFSVPESSSPATNLRTVSRFLHGKAGQSLSELEVAGLISLIQKSTPAEKSEPFRFSSSSSASASKDNSPTLPNANGSIFGSTSSEPQPSTAPKRMLTRNPNGVYRWQGAGSAKAGRSRNRYSSPAFGPTRSSERLMIKDTESLKSDSKRRRVEEEATSTSTPNGSAPTDNNNDQAAFRTSAAPEPTPGRVQLANSIPLAHPIPTTPTKQSTGSTLRPRVAVPPKPTTPANPSPLRQAWTGNSPQSDKSDDSPPPARQTKAANFMAELIKEVTPPKKPDLSNPYQAANPFVKYPSKPKPKRTRPARQPPAAKEQDKGKGKEEEKEGEDLGAAEEKEKELPVEKEYSPQAIIEATVPKGSKRSRPPAYFTKPEQATSIRGTQSQQLAATEESETMEEVEEQRATKKTKPSTDDVATAPTTTHVPLEPHRVNTVTARDTPKPELKPDAPAVPEQPKSSFLSISPANGSAAHSTLPSGPASPTKGPARPALSTIPKEPSKLRFVIQPESPGSIASPESSPSLPPTSTPSIVDQPTPTDPKQTALLLPRSSLPVFKLAPPAPMLSASTEHTKVKDEVMALAKASLPSFKFTLGNKANGVATTSAGSNESSKSNAPLVTTTDFNWDAAGMKQSSAPAGGNWTCSTCMLSNPPTATEKCTICDAPKPGSSLPSSSSKSGGFDYAAAGMKTPSAPAEGNWTCSTCMLSNPPSATEKCTICDASKPKSSSSSSSTGGGFNWLAAGMKAPSAPADGKWTCSTCMLSNPATAKDKCTICDTPR
ncbi:hypothetical protein AX16_001384 [Volvariella volvacea WC 439]|nr:hypothetical protein AX16_001384 [Volvariella volvacea WC 439]